jgi:hypothetical protein
VNAAHLNTPTRRVFIESEVELDVVAGYTAAGRNEQVETLHTERAPPRPRKAGAGEVSV